MERILQKVHGPKLIRPLCLGNIDSSLSCQLLSSSYPYFELFLSINAFRSLLVYYQTFAFEKLMEPTTTMPFALRCKLLHPGTKRFVLIRFPFVPQGIPAQVHEAAGAAITQPKAIYDVGGGIPPCLGR
jgi:hypothetical protein